MKHTPHAHDGALALTARILLALLFLGSGLSKLGTPAASQAMIASAGITQAGLAYVAAIAVEIGGGVLLMLGYRTRFAAASLAIFTLAATLMFHSNFADQNQMIHAMKNVAIIGGLLQVLAFGPGAISVDRRRWDRATRSVATA